MKFILREVTSGNQEKKRGGGENHKEKHENEKKMIDSMIEHANNIVARF